LFSRSLWPVSLVDLNCIVSLPHMCTTFSWSYFLADVPLSPFPGVDSRRSVLLVDLPSRSPF
jgi:hypothetical protein